LLNFSKLFGGYLSGIYICDSIVRFRKHLQGLAHKLLPELIKPSMLVPSNWAFTFSLMFSEGSMSPEPVSW